MCGARLRRAERGVQQTRQAAHVIARRELRHHSTEGAVQIDLAPELMSQ